MWTDNQTQTMKYMTHIYYDKSDRQGNAIVSKPGDTVTFDDAKAVDHAKTAPPLDHVL